MFELQVRTSSPRLTASQTVHPVRPGYMPFAKIFLDAPCRVGRSGVFTTFRSVPCCFLRWLLEQILGNVKIAMHRARNVVWCGADPFTRSGGMDRMGHCQRGPTRWSGSALYEKDLVIAMMARSSGQGGHGTNRQPRVETPCGGTAGHLSAGVVCASSRWMMLNTKPLVCAYSRCWCCPG